MLTKPTEKEFHPYAKTYINKIGSEVLINVLSTDQTIFYSSIPTDKIDYKYGEDKWTIKEVLGHIIDVERVFQYRALRIGRGDKTPLPGFDHDTFVLKSNCNLRTYDSLIDEYKAVRSSTIFLYKSFTNDNLMHIGTASDHPFSTRAVLYMIAGHERHHIDILKERYL